MTDQTTLLKDILRLLPDADPGSLRDVLTLLQRRYAHASVDQLSLQDLRMDMPRLFGMLDERLVRELWLNLLLAGGPAMAVYLQDGYVRATPDEARAITLETAGFWLLPTDFVKACALALLTRDADPELRAQLAGVTRSQQDLLFKWANSIDK